MKSYNEDEEELRFLGKILSAGKGALCPPSSLFAEYAVGNVSRKERELMEKHLASCRHREDVMLHKQLHHYRHSLRCQIRGYPILSGSLR